MSDPKRLLDLRDSSFERTLLAAGAKEHPPTGGEERALAALGIVTAATFGAGAAAPVAGVTAVKAGASAEAAALTVSKIASAVAMTMKWTAAAGIVTAAAAGTVAYVANPRATDPAPLARPIAAGGPRAQETPRPLDKARPASAPSAETALPPASAALPAPARSAFVAPAPSAFAVPAPRTAAKTATPAPPSTAWPPPPAGAPAASMPLSLELGELDQARTMLRTGNPRGALRALDAYDARFPAGVLREEAEVARIEALVEADDKARAADRANAFLAARPASAYAARVRHLLAKTNPANP